MSIQKKETFNKYCHILGFFEQFLKSPESFIYPTTSGQYLPADQEKDRKTIKAFLNEDKDGISLAMKLKQMSLFDEQMRPFLPKIKAFVKEKLKIQDFNNGQLHAALGAFEKKIIGIDDIKNCFQEEKGKKISRKIKDSKEPSMLSQEKHIIWKQMIFFGAPGTGKSTAVKKLTGEDESMQKERRVFRTTFHPDYDYSTFVGAYKPCPGNINAGEPPITYKFEEQIFIKAYIAAWKAFCKNEPDPIWLVIEEINRGNCAQIFGDIFQLLDRNESGFSKFPINCNRDLEKWLENNKDYETLRKSNKDVPSCDKLYIPPTLSIVATMNTSDQSLFPMDSAFKRRWRWEYIRINTDKENNDAVSYRIALKCGDGTHQYSWIDFIKKVNVKILNLTSSEDKQLGTYFITGSVDTDEFTGKVMFYLWNDICKEEYLGNKDNFMRSKYSPRVRENTDEFTFNNLFEDDEKCRGDILKGFMEYLEIPEISSVENTETKNSDNPAQE